MSKRALAVCLSLALGGATTASADSLHVTADTMVSAARPNRTYGDAATAVVKGGTDEVHAYARFDLAALGTPPGAQVRRGTLRVWVGSPVGGGHLLVRPALGPWDEGTITWNTVPSLGSPLPAVDVTAADALGYLSIDVTPLVQGWISGQAVNEGLALVPDTSGLDLRFDSKESTSTSHAMELEVVLEDADSGGDVTAVNTPAGSGLQGGAASGDATLGLVTGCAGGQILKWTGAAWVCAADLQGGLVRLEPDR